METTNDKWYQNPVVIIILLFIFFPSGIYLMWKYTNLEKKNKWIFSILFTIVGLIGISIIGSEPSSQVAPINQQPAQPTQQSASDQELFAKLIQCEDKGEVEAAKYYDSQCSACPEFISGDVSKLAMKMQEIERACKTDIENTYNITEEATVELLVDAVIKNWVMPEKAPFPTCCNY